MNSESNQFTLRVGVFALLASLCAFLSVADDTSRWGNYRAADGRILSVGPSADTRGMFVFDQHTNEYVTIERQDENLFSSTSKGVTVRWRDGSRIVYTNRTRTTAIRQPLSVLDVEIKSNDAGFAGHVWLPVSAKKVPALLLLGGSGSYSRNDFRVYPLFFVQHGFAALTIDKPHPREEGIRALADDAALAIEFLRSRPEVDAARVGVAGFSHGAWVAVEVAARDSGIAFLLPVVGGGVPLWRATLYDMVRHMEKKFTREQVNAANAMMNGLIDLARQQRYDDVKPMLSRFSAEPWFGDTPVAPLATLSADAVAQISKSLWENELSYDPADTLAHVSCPILAVVAERDDYVPPAENAAAIVKAARAGKNPYVQVLKLPRANHWQNLSAAYATDFTYAPALFPKLGKWLDETKKPRRSGASR